MKQSPVAPPPDKPSFTEIIFTVVLTLIKWILILSWRFATGNFMDGKPRQFRGLKQHRKTWWNQTTRWQRTKWRHAIFWPLVFTVYLWTFQFWMAVILFSCMAPAIAFFAYRWWLRTTHRKIKVTSDKKVSWYWTDKLWWRDFKAKFRRKRTVEKIRLQRELEHVSEDEKKLITAEIADEGGMPVTTIRKIVPGSKVDW